MTDDYLMYLIVLKNRNENMKVTSRSTKEHCAITL